MIDVDDQHMSEEDFEAERLCEEFELYEDKIAQMEELDHDLIKHGLAHHWDVIVAEALDCIMDYDAVDKFRDKILDLANNNDSSLIQGRLRLCVAISQKGNFEEVKDILSKNRYLYYKIWEWTALYIETRDKKWSSRLEKTARSKNMRHASISKELLNFIGAYLEYKRTK